MDRAAIEPDPLTFAKATIAGAGLAGLGAAVALRKAGIAVSIADSAAQAGGRCRSYFDPQLGLTIDNGNHLIASGNRAVARFRAAIGATGGLIEPAQADFPFCDLATEEQWTLRINDGRVPWWVFAPGRRIPGTKTLDYAPLARLLYAAPGETVADRVSTHGPLWTRLLEPVLLAALNTAPEQGSARLAAAIIRETVGRGGQAMKPMVAHPTLGAALIDPAVAWLGAEGAPLRLGRRLRALGFEGDRVASLDWGDGPEPVVADEAVVLAASAPVAMQLVPGLTAPDAFRAIVNAHFAYPPPTDAPPVMALLGGTAEWVLALPDRISVTVSAADRLIDTDRETLAATLWGDVQRAYGITTPLPRWQIVKEKRATFAATPEQDAKRPPTRTRWRNLFLAGDWTQTGLPATIEGALRSGEAAARGVVGR